MRHQPKYSCLTAISACGALTLLPACGGEPVGDEQTAAAQQAIQDPVPGDLPPSTVRITIPPVDTLDSLRSCMGTVVGGQPLAGNKAWILTAAHCFATGFGPEDYEGKFLGVEEQNGNQTLAGIGTDQLEVYFHPAAFQFTTDPEPTWDREVFARELDCGHDLALVRISRADGTGITTPSAKLYHPNCFPQLGGAPPICNNNLAGLSASFGGQGLEAFERGETTIAGVQDGATLPRPEECGDLRGPLLITRTGSLGGRGDSGAGLHGTAPTSSVAMKLTACESLAPAEKGEDALVGVLSGGVIDKPTGRTELS